MDIKFGTSGWRAIISDEFSFENVRLVTQAIANYIKQNKQKGRMLVIVGYDTRFLSKEFAEEAARVLAFNKIKVLIANRDIPTPCVSLHIVANKACGGINITASHNPPEYNGIKFSPETGAPAPPDVTKEIEDEIKRLQAKGFRFEAAAINERYIKVFDPRPRYFKQIKRVVNLNAIKRANLKIAIDCLYGTSRDYLDAILKKARCKILILHNQLNPYFEGKRPEPSPENLKELINCVKKNRLDLGLAIDGDGDRFGIVDSDGAIITPNQVIPLLLYHLAKTRPIKKNAMAARTIATTHLVDAICKRLGFEVYETPVGFKYFAPLLTKKSCIIAGEESGGLSISGHLAEKDGILACLLVAEMVAINKRPVKKLLASLYKNFGHFYSHRLDLHLKPKQKDALINRLTKGAIEKYAGGPVVEIKKIDGLRFTFGDKSWALFRSSGTEPVVRCYFEAETKARLNKLIAAGKKLVLL